MKYLSWKKISITLLLVLLILVVKSEKENVFAQSCSGGWGCGAWVTSCLPEGCSRDDCNDSVDPCDWVTYCDDGYEDNDCDGSTMAECLSSYCSVYSCSGPNNVTCNWSAPAPPPPEPPPPPPDCIYNCGDMDCCTPDGENSTNCPDDCGGVSGTECWYCASSVSCTFGSPGAKSCGCSDCVFGRIGGLVFWDKNGNGVWDGDATDARVITSEANRVCGDFGQSDVVIPGLQVQGGGNFGSPINVDNNCDALNDDRPSCATKRCADPGTSNGRCWNCGGTCFVEGIGNRDAEQWSWCGGEISRSCFTQWYGSCKSSSFCVEGGKKDQAGSWVKTFVPYDDGNPNYDNTLLRNRIFTKNVRVGTYQLQLIGLPEGWEVTTSPPIVTAVNSGLDTCSATPAYFALRRNYSCEIILVTPPNGISVGQPASGIVYTSSIEPSDASIDNVVFTITSGSSVSLSNPDEGIPDTAPAFTVTITGESVGTSTVQALATMDDGVTTCVTSADITVNDRSWFQTQGSGLSCGSSVTGQGDLQSVIPGTASEPYLIKNGANFNPALTRDHGVAVYSSSSAPNLGGGDVSSDPARDWLVNSSYQGYTYNYSYFRNKLAPEIFSNNIGPSVSNMNDWHQNDIYNGYEWYFYDGSLAVNAGLDLSIDIATDFTNRKVVLFVENADLYINQTINLLDGTGFFLAIVEGDIIVDSSIGGPISPGSTPNLEGIFFAGDAFQTLSQSPDADTQLYLRGSVVAGTFTLQRDLQTDNATFPAEYIEHAPDLLFHYPKVLGAKSMQWKEVAP